MPVIDRFYSTKEAASILGLTEGRICQLCRWNEGIGTKFGRDWILTEADLEKIRNLPDGRKKNGLT